MKTNLIPELILESNNSTSPSNLLPNTNNINFKLPIIP
jgi:hypothetical protein